jgi:hypothetical protein
MGSTARAADTSVRIDRRTSSVLTRLSEETGMDKRKLVATAVERMRRERLLDGLNAGLAALKADPAAWAEETGDRELWDSTLSDGTEDE